MLGPGGSSRAYSDQVGGKSLSPLQTLNLPTQDQCGPQVAPCSPMLPKNGALRPEVWGPTSSNGLQKDWISGRSGMMEMDCRNLPTDYSSAILDQAPEQITDPYRVPGGLARYHSAPSALLQSLADFQQEVVPRPLSQLDSSLSSLFTDADLPPLSQSNDTSLEPMETEHSSNSVFDKYSMMNTRKFDNRLGKPGAHYDQLGSVNGPTKPHMMQSVFKPSMDVLHENVTGNTQMNSQMNAQINSQLNSQMTSSSQMPSTIGLSSTMGLLGQQDNIHAGQQMGLGNLAQSIGNTLGNDFPGSFTGSSGTLAGLASTRLTHKVNNTNSLLRQSSSPAGLLAQLSIEVQAMVGTAKGEKQSLSSPLAHSPAESLSGGTSDENGGAGTGPGTPGMMSRMDAGAWEDAQSYMNSWDSTNFAARKRFRDMEIDPLGESFMPDPLRSSQDHNPPPLTRHMSLPAQKSKNSTITEDILQSVPCRIRAKRGCATHPRSIAERVRRTRISERMRKLQELVPNMDKQQTNTADMLDEAVEYVKQLQRQVQELTESKCKGNCRERKDSSPSS